MTRTCGVCTYYVATKPCLATNWATDNNTPACSLFVVDEWAALQRRDRNVGKGDEDSMPRKVSAEVEQQIVDAYKRIGNVNRTASEVNVGWSTVSRVLTEAGLLPSRKHEKKDQSVSSKLELTTDARSAIISDLEEAQRALAVIDAIRQAYGESPELELAVVVEYMRRRVA